MKRKRGTENYDTVEPVICTHPEGRFVHSHYCPAACECFVLSTGKSLFSLCLSFVFSLLLCTVLYGTYISFLPAAGPRKKSHSSHLPTSYSNLPHPPLFFTYYYSTAPLPPHTHTDHHVLITDPFSLSP